MAIEGLDAALPIESAAFLPQAELPRAADGEFTLDAALAQAARDAIRVSAAPDLWLTDAMRSPARPAGQPAAPEAPTPVSGDASAVPEAPADHPIVKEKLSLAEMGHMLRNRQYDSTDYGWEEMSTADWEWATENFKQDVYAGVEQATAGATSQAQAEQLAQAYLNSMGLGSIVHVGPPADPNDDAIVVTAQTYHHPDNYMPILSLDQPGFDSFDPRMVYDILDVSAQTVEVDPGVEMNDANRLALDRLLEIRSRVTNYLHSLPSTGVFLTPKGPITVAELLARWARTDFHITPEGTSYAANGISGFPGAGAAYYNGGDPVFETSINYLRQFMADPDRALFYILHELGHVTAIGYQDFLTIRPPGGPEPSQTVFGASERFFNDLARVMADTMGHPLPGNFPPNIWNFNADPQITFVADPSSSGGSGGGHGDVPWD